MKFTHKNISYFTAIGSPIKAIRFLKGEKLPLTDEIVYNCIKRIYSVDKASILGYLAELMNSKDLFIQKNKIKGLEQYGSGTNNTLGKFLYVLVRTLKPKVIIETGVSHGHSSWLILNALKLNGFGQCISVDLPNKDNNSNYNISNFQLEPGWVVPDSLKKYWRLCLGDTKDILPKLREEISALDIFFHDSDHSYQHMKFEFEFAKSILRPGGIVISDDVHKNNAFTEFTENNSLAFMFTKGGFCVV